VGAERSRAERADAIGAVEVVADPELARELAARLAEPPRFPTVTVSDLLAPRRAYWRRSGRAGTVAAPRTERMEIGRRWHRRLLSPLGGEGRFEVRLRRDGIAGRIDLLADVPVEIKTRAGESVGERAPARADELDQLGIYCALSERPTGRLVLLLPHSDRGPTVRALDATYGDLPSLRAGVVERAEALRHALAPGGTPRELPRCPWFGRGCEFQAARACDCSGDEPIERSVLSDRITSLEARGDVEERWDGLLASLSPDAPSAKIRRFRELVYLRRAYFDRGASAEEGADRPPVAASIAPRLYDRVLDVTEGGPAGDVAALRPIGEEPDEEVTGFRDRPYLLRTSMAWAPILPSEALRRAPQYALELGFRCAATGVGEGLVVLAYERAEEDRDRLQVLRYRFPDLPRFARLWQERSVALLDAVTRQDPSTLPPCPSWMYEECPYRGACGCAEETPRSHR